MKRFFVILFLIPSIAFGAYTEFYCDASNGSNLNSGSDAGTSVYTSTNGGWNSGTGVFTPTDGSNPATAVPGVTVGQFASVYIDGATVGVFVGRVTAVTNATNGTITVSTAAVIGSPPATNASARTIKVGGCWKGPNAASAFPFSLNGMGSARDASSNPMRVNLKNNSTYSITSSMTWANATNPWFTQGYSSTVGDGGKATIDGSTSTAGVIGDVGLASNTISDIIFTTSFTSGSTNLISTTRATNFVRCVFKGARGSCVNLTGASTLTECEAYDCNKSNTASQGGFLASDSVRFVRCVAHDNSGNANSGFVLNGGSATLINCISDTNGLYGVNITSGSNLTMNSIINSDIYNNTSDGVHTAASGPGLLIENTNLIKNGGAGINNATKAQGFSFNNGYGAGTQANGSGDTLLNIAESGKVTYASNVTPWVDPANGDFRINLSAAYNAGRGAFTETQGYSSPNTVGYPDIGAANHNDSCGGTGPCQTSGASSY